jgi:hypothetical protein
MLSIEGVSLVPLLKATLKSVISLNLTFLCAAYGSLYLSSSLSLVRLSGLLFLLATKIIPICVQLEKSYLLQSYNTHIFCNAYIFSSELQEGIMEGLNVTYLIHLVSSKMRLLLTSFDIESAPGAVGLILTGRVKGHAGNRWVAGVDALCIGSFTSRILDVGYETFVSSLGLVGIKVGIII